METQYSAEIERLTNYTLRRKLHLADCLGWGVDGIVYSTNKGSAVKAHRGKRLFEQELEVYKRLAMHPDNAIP